MAFLGVGDTSTVKEIVSGVSDGVFRNSVMLSYLRKNSLERWDGGSVFQENLLYDTLIPTEYTPGDTFDLSQQQLATGATVSPRYYNVPVTAYIEKLRVELAGPRAAFNYVDMLLQNAAMAMSARLAIDLFENGQSAGRTAKINGLDEALSDGTTNGFRAATYATYLTLTRSALNGALNSPMTGPAASVGGAISYPVLEQTWQSVCVGPEKPDLMLTTNLGISYIKMAFQAQQRFESATSEFGFNTFKFNGTDVVADQYAPGTRTATAVDTKLGYTAVSTGETLWFLNTKHMRLYLSTDELFAFGFTGFMPDPANSVVAGHYKALLNFTVQQPRFNRYLFAITG